MVRLIHYRRDVARICQVEIAATGVSIRRYGTYSITNYPL